MNAQSENILIKDNPSNILNIHNIPDNLTDIRSLAPDELEIWFKSMGLPAYRGKQLFKWLWKKEFAGFDDISDFPVSLREELKKTACIFDIKPVEEFTSQKDQTKKWVFELFDGNYIESVLIPEPTRQTICLSTQVGCQMGCAFCMTGKMGFKRNLFASEIVLQVLTIMKILNLSEKPRNLVFMGMGEPLANLGNLIKALKILTSQTGLNYSLRHITVSTSGLIPQMLELGETLDAGLAISLHATENKTRDMLMPINRKYPLEMLLAACREYNLSPRKRITFEYILIKDINDSIEDARRLVKLLSNIKAKINLIPFNECEALPFKKPSPKAISSFQQILLDKNFTSVIRKSKGSDIMAACGQLYKKYSGQER